MAEANTHRNLRIAFVVQRYGKDCLGGAEWHCQEVAQRLAKDWQVDILTTCAKDYTTWANVYPPGEELIDGVTVRRFAVDFKRPKILFDHCYDFLINLYLWLLDGDEAILGHRNGLDLLDIRRRIRFILHPKLWLTKIFCSLLEAFWMRLQGPTSSSLLRYLRKNRNTYDGFFFFSYTYATTFYGLPLVAKKAVLIPTAHNDSCLAFKIFDRLFARTKRLIYMTPEERDLIHTRFATTRNKPSTIAAVGKEKHAAPDTGITQAIGGPYILCLGRFEESKGSFELVRYFKAFKHATGHEIKLVFAGPVFSANLPGAEENDGIVLLGAVSEDDKWTLIRHSTLLVNPSHYESLSIVVLEAWLEKKPVFVNGHCAVLHGQCERSSGGASYTNELEFEQLLSLLLGDKALLEEMGEKGHGYALANYNWPKILAEYRRMITF